LKFLGWSLGENFTWQFCQNTFSSNQEIEMELA